MHCIISPSAAAQHSGLVAAILAVVAMVHDVQLQQHAPSGLGVSLPSPSWLEGRGSRSHLGKLSHYTGR
eukprot:14694343-Heterocapsa_arctica.AAC.1